MRRGQLHVLQPDASTCGGLAEARRMADAAAPFGVRVVPHVCAGPISLAANLHLAATVPAIRLIEYPPSLAEAWSTFGAGIELGPNAIVDGKLAVPDGPGLGVELDEDALAPPLPSTRCPRRRHRRRSSRSLRRRPLTMDTEERTMTAEMTDEFTGRSGRACPSSAPST